MCERRASAYTAPNWAQELAWFSRYQSVEPRPEDRRKYHRFKAPKESVVTWKSTGQNFVSRVEAIGLGGVFLYTANPLALNSVINLIFHLALGKVHAPPAVRRLIPGKGMGVRVAQMLPEDGA